MIAVDNLWISLSKHAGQSSTELNSIKLSDILAQFWQLPISPSHVEASSICELWCRGIANAPEAEHDGLLMVCL
jgi:hypothetical protein